MTKQFQWRSSRTLTKRDAAHLSVAHLLEDAKADNALLRAALEKSENAGVRRDLVMRELQHRIGNILAVIDAIARQTFKSVEPIALAVFHARIQALAAAQKVLIDSEIRPARMKEVIAAALAPHIGDHGRWTISGPNLRLNGHRAHALTLALHELATNAVKYGALSTEAGTVRIEWSAADGRLDFQWLETGGPKVCVPTAHGFGRILITQNLAHAFSGEARLSFGEAGVECRLLAPDDPA